MEGRLGRGLDTAAWTHPAKHPARFHFSIRNELACRVINRNLFNPGFYEGFLEHWDCAYGSLNHCHAHGVFLRHHYLLRFRLAAGRAGIVSGALLWNGADYDTDGDHHPYRLFRAGMASPISRKGDGAASISLDRKSTRLN